MKARTLTASSSGAILGTAMVARSAFAAALLILPAALSAAPALAPASAPASAPAPVTPGRWATASDPVARKLIEQERRWGVDGCTPSAVVKDFIAADFVGTSPKGTLYTKTSMLPSAPAAVAAAPEKERDCKLLSAKVRYFGTQIAVIYGSESAVVTAPDGTEVTRTLIWTDTVMRRNGKWQVIAVQDMVAPPGWTAADHTPPK